MEPSTVAGLLNLGAAGAVIIVVYYLVSTFLKFIRERDKEWQAYFSTLNEANCRDAERRWQLTEKLVELVKEDTQVNQAILAELRQHDNETQKRIDAAVEKVKSGK